MGSGKRAGTDERKLNFLGWQVKTSVKNGFFRTVTGNKINFLDMELMGKSIKQFIKFGLVGVSNTLLSLAVYYIFLWINADLYLVGNIAGWLVSVANAFFWSQKYVFVSEKASLASTLKKLLKTYCSYGATFLLSTLLLYLEVDLWQWPASISPLLNLLLTVPLNFLLNKFWVFRR